MQVYFDKEEILNNKHISPNKLKVNQYMKLNSSGDSTLPVSPYKELIGSENKFRIVSSPPQVLMWMSGHDMSYNFFNKSWNDFTGRHVATEKNSGWMDHIHPEDLEKYENIYKTSFNARKQFYVEFRLKRHDGEYRWLANYGEPRYSTDGKFEGYIGNCIEIHDTKISAVSIEQKISEKTRTLNEKVSRLEQSNLELTQFAYVATHDLQEPLRKIKIFTERLLIKASSRLTDDEIFYINKIKASTTRMSDLIKDVLEYSVLSKSSEPFPKTDLNTIINNVLVDFELLITQKKAKFFIDQLPSIEAVPLQMNQLFNNLISNSLKFTRDSVIPAITIRQLPLTNNEKKALDLNMNMPYIKISFSDNGIGFNKEYSAKIFEIFQRLNGNEKYPGNGIGLALCKKIINNHKGEIFAESTEDNGATFQIILPLAQEL